MSFPFLEMENIVNIHYFDKEAFMNVDIVEKYEEVMIFLESPSYDEVVEETHSRLKWVDASEQVELVGRYDVGSAQKSRMKTMPISAPINDDDHDSEEEYERRRTNVGDVEAQVRHKDMDPDIIYKRACVDDSDDECPLNELGEDDFTEKEAEWYTKITGRDHKVPLFCEVSLADKAIVDSGMIKTIEARQFPSSTFDEISMSYLRKCLMFEHMLEFKMWLCKYNGTLMIAMTHDANDQVLPVAFALVSVENQDNWEWFMRLVRSTVIPPNREGARELPVTAIAEYTFYKLNEYFLKHSDEIDKLIVDSEKPPNEIYPNKVAEWLEFRKDKLAIRRATYFNNVEMKYQVDEPDMAASQPNKATMKGVEEKDVKGEMSDGGRRLRRR
ncbi:hypothetical protein D1007_35172 [Hordeum vulgare]|nr:hypothetical protein D1007_35172 [Hordeum vulgare]